MLLTYLLTYLFTYLLTYDNCHYHKIITLEQAAGKKGVWGCTEQQLINKSIMSEVRNKKRNVITIWLDYKKAFDSVPHE